MITQHEYKRIMKLLEKELIEIFEGEKGIIGIRFIQYHNTETLKSLSKLMKKYMMI
jgi:hypothetical protein